ncbi:MAG: NAD(P)-binding domain-containing protein [Marinilabiliales bacterium]|nr:NAD(P)-binding domain-containing protein [Marinilabiliales bacterium]
MRILSLEEALGVDSHRSLPRVPARSEVRSRAVVLATGVSYRRIGIESVDAFVGRGVFYGAATTEAPAMRGEEVYVVGGANSAGRAALHLSRFAARVTVLVRGSSLAATNVRLPGSRDQGVAECRRAAEPRGCRGARRPALEICSC